MFSKRQPSETAQVNGEDPDEKCVDKILDKADENIEIFNFEEAHEYCQKALALEPENLRAVEMAASLSMEMGDVDGALDGYNRAVQLSPDSGYNKYLSLGQLSVGKFSLKYYQKGIEILEKEIEENARKITNSSTSNEPEENLPRVLSNAYCAVAELYMTDLCDEESADETCYACIKRAIDSDSTNPEAYQSMTSYLLIKGEETNAREMMEKSLSFWFPQYQAIRNGEAVCDGVEVCELNYSSRINAVKLLVELEMFSESEIILNGLVEEDDEVVEVWYLLGWMNHLRGDDYKGNARYYFHKCKKVCDKIGCNDEQLINHVKELIEEYGPSNDDDDDEDEEEDDDKENVSDDSSYVDIDSSEDEMEEN